MLRFTRSEVANRLEIYTRELKGHTETLEDIMGRVLDTWQQFKQRKKDNPSLIRDITVSRISSANSGQSRIGLKTCLLISGWVPPNITAHKIVVEFCNDLVGACPIEISHVYLGNLAFELVEDRD